ncbi:hypothetical protein BH10CYA1_BH10CYA1_14300 [soil metagenome]
MFAIEVLPASMVAFCKATELSFPAGLRLTCDVHGIAVVHRAASGRRTAQGARDGSKAQPIGENRQQVTAWITIVPENNWR